MATCEQVLQNLRESMRVRHLSLRTEEAYCHWVRRYSDYLRTLDPAQSSEKKVSAWISDLAVRQGVAAKTQSPAGGYCEHPRVPGLRVRWRLHEASLQRAVSDARTRAGIATPITPHVLRHGYASHSIEDPRTIQRVMGHAQLETTMGYIHRDVAAARSPLETLEAPCA